MSKRLHMKKYMIILEIKRLFNRSINHNGKKYLYFQYLGLGVELLTPSNRSTTKQQRQTSQRAQDFDQDLRQEQIN
jgi:hypothetical protein